MIMSNNFHKKEKFHTLYTKKEDCCGCWACESICPQNAIQMRVDEEGFLYAYALDQLCVHCGLCERVCPIIRADQRPKQIITKEVAAKS